MGYSIAFAPNSPAALIDALAYRGYAVADKFLDEATVAALRSRALRRDANGDFAQAEIGRGAARVACPDIRSDRICWLDAATQHFAERTLLAKLEALRLAANRTLQLGALNFEAHYAIYPPGRGYALHLDRFRDDDARVLSIVVYINDRWQAKNGGTLRLHPNGEAIDVAPQGGTLAVFLSDRIAHEVLPAARQRLSIAGWFRRRV